MMPIWLLTGILTRFLMSKGRDLMVSNGAGARGHDKCQEGLPVLSFRGLPNKVPQTEWLQTTEVCCLLVLEVGNLKSRCHKDRTPSEADRESLPCFFLASSCLQATVGFPWLVDASLQSSIFTSSWVSSYCLPSVCVCLHF